MTPYYQDDQMTVWQQDNRALLPTLAENSIDACITDPPYHLTQATRNSSPRQNDVHTPYGRTRLGERGFMGKTWDGGDIAHDPEFWAMVLRVLKPGANLVAFGGTRTHHRLMVALEDAGFEIRDCLVWLFGSGFPKSLEVSKALDRAAGVEREAVWQGPYATRRPRQDKANDGLVFADDAYVRPAGDTRSAPATDLAQRWDGWGTALKPAYEPIILARKPLSGTVAQNVQRWGVGGLNVDGCRIGAEATKQWASPRGGIWRTDPTARARLLDNTAGRWPANVVLDEEAAAMLDETVGERSVSGAARTGRPATADSGGMFGIGKGNGTLHNDRGGPSRFFYTAKAARSEREAGLEGESQKRGDGRRTEMENPRLRTSPRRNTHPTVKPVDLMAWLVRLVTPPGGVVLDPFMGSGSTRIACQREAMRFVGIELEEEYCRIAVSRLGQYGLPMDASARPERGQG